MTRFNFSGWNVKDWVLGNFKDLNKKDLAKAVIPLLALWFTTGSFWITIPGAIAGKAILDLLHYWVSK